MQGIVQSHEQGESCKGDSQLHSLRCKGADTDKITWWCSLFCHFHGWSQKVWVYFMWEKSEVFAKFKEWKAEVENQIGRKIKYLLNDNEGEYRDGRFMKFCKQQVLLVTSPWRRLRSIRAQQKGWTGLLWREMHKTSWGIAWIFLGESINHDAFLVNRSPSKLLDSRCAEEV